MTSAAPAITALKPFYKWPGGKGRLLPQILPVLTPYLAAAAQYMEPFLGGGAVYFAAGHHAPAALLSDHNPHIVATMIAVRDRPDQVLERFGEHAAQHSPEHYYSLRPAMRVVPTDFGNPDKLVEAAARFLYMNKATYNGLYRENASGGFNAPYGDGRPVKMDEVKLRAASAALQTATIRWGSYDAQVAPGAGDVAYVDPPYLPASRTANFTSYTAGGFAGGDQLRLAAWCRRAADRGAVVVLSNAGTPESLGVFVRDASSGRGADEVIPIPAAPRAISCKASARLPVPEYLFVYRPQ